MPEEVVVLFLFVVAGFIFGSFAYYVAEEKGLSRWSWFVLGFVFNIVALIAICGVPKFPSPEYMVKPKALFHS